MKVLELQLKHFRNYAQGLFRPGPGITILHGQNAQGKTNILEAVFLCCLGRSHRTAKDKELISHDEQTALVQLSCEKTGVKRNIRMNLIRDERRKLLIDGQPAQNIGQLMGQLNCVLFAPEHLNIVKLGPLERRRFIDMEISQTHPAYFYSLQQFNRVLRQRNKLLKLAYEQPELLETLPAWNEQFARLSAYIIEQRLAFLERLSKLAAQNHSDISGGKESLAIAYEPNLGLVDEGQILDKLEQGKKQDLRFGSTQIGPHRDDFSMFLSGRDLKLYGSQGQIRTATLALKLSELDFIHEETDEWPILMLDDVFSELDEQRQGYLLERVFPVQTLITTTKPVESPLNMDAYRVENGELFFEGQPD